MLNLIFTSDKDKRLKTSRSSVGLGKWIIRVGGHIFFLSRTHGKWKLQLKFFAKQPVNIKVGKKLIGTVNAKTSLGTVFEYPCKETVQKIKRVILEEKEKCVAETESILVRTKRPHRNFWELPLHEELVYETFNVNPKKPFLTYYACKGDISFGYVSEQHMLHLPFNGWNVKWVLQGEMIRWNQAIPSPVGILHPLLFPWFIGQAKIKHMKMLKKNHKKLVGFDVADTDAISKKAIAFANKADLLMVPSQHSKDVYIKSGLSTRIEVVPHGLSQLYDEPKQPHSGTIKILFFNMHSPFRKGADVVKKVMSKILKTKVDVNFVVKTRYDIKLPRTKIIQKKLNNKELIRLYDSCDILLAPSRGGGFEKNVLEGLARGLVVITSDWPAIQEYAGSHVLTVKSEGKKKILPGNPVHVGYGVNPSVEHCVKMINYALDNLEDLKQKSEKNMNKIRKQYSWQTITEKIVECLT